ncbi:competence type IV pilus minor pilin ComGG [Microbacteriaceae bacterium 4G12]
MNNERGVALPFVLLFSFILFAFFIHQANLLVLEKKFFQETEELFLLDIVMNNAIRDFQREVKEEGFLQERIYNYEEGRAQVLPTPLQDSMMKVTIECKTKQNRTYKASFQYNKDNQQVNNWIEER